jgi:uncharacterized protein (DUF1697 family)
VKPGKRQGDGAVAPERCVALLRGINVGRGKRLPMAELSALLAALGCSDVRTLLNSGNAVFAATAAPDVLAAQLQAALHEQLGLDVPVQVRGGALFRAIVADNGLAARADDPARLLVAFPAPGQACSALATLARLAAGLGDTGALHIGAHAAYLWCPQGVLESALGAALLGKAGAAYTTRNWATVLKIAAAL